MSMFVYIQQFGETLNTSLQHISTTGAYSVLASKCERGMLYSLEFTAPKTLGILHWCVVLLPFSNVVHCFPTCPAFLPFG